MVSSTRENVLSKTGGEYEGETSFRKKTEGQEEMARVKNESFLVKQEAG